MSLRSPGSADVEPGVAFPFEARLTATFLTSEAPLYARVSSNHQNEPKKIKKSQELDLMLSTLSFEERILWWARDEPYIYKKKRYRIDGSTILRPSDIQTDGLENLLSVAAPVASACFGEVITYVRFRRLEWGWNGRTKSKYQSRCFRCKARKACRQLVAERLSVIDGGLEKLDRANAKAAGYPEHNPFRSSSPHDFRHALLEHGPFADANADLVRKLRTERLEQERANDAYRKRIARKRGYENGELDPDYLVVAIAERDRRERILLSARHASGATRTLSKLTDASCAFVADVWLCEWVNHWRKDTLRNVDIADWLITHDRHQQQDRGSLQGRVAEDRKRIKRLEQEGTPPLWAAFSPEAAIAAAHREGIT